MNLSKPQLVIIAAAGAVVLVFALIFLGIIPGLQSSSADPTKIKASLNFWGAGDPGDAYAEAFAAMKSLYPNVTMNYRNFANEDDYNSALLNALAAGQGPDVFMIRNTDLPANVNKLAPAPSARLSPLQLNQLFPQVVSKDFVYQNNVFAVPLSIDTLALIYNRDLFDQAAAPLPANWRSWDDFVSAVPKLAKRSSNGRLVQAAAAMGESSNISNAPDILYLLMLQLGAPMINEQTGGAAFSSRAGTQALNFYSQFSSQSSGAYAWDSYLPDSLEAFSQGKAAMLIDYASALREARLRNGFLNAEVAPVPQPTGAAAPVNYPKYWGYAVSKQSQYQGPAWSFILSMTTNESVADGYLQRTKKPPALNLLIYKYQSDPALGVFARQALTAKSWPEPARAFVDQAVSDMINSAASGNVAAGSALEQTQNKINQYLSQHSF